MTTDKVLDKLSKLKAMAEGEAKIGNAAAAEAFAEAINRLLLQHELSATDIPTRAAAEEPIVELRVDLSAFGVKRTGVRVGWQEALARVVADAHLCKFLVTRGSNTITFVGTHAHVAVAEYAFGVLTSSADRMSMAARVQWWKDSCGGQHLASGNFRAAWLTGFIERIAERFAEARRSEVRATGNTSTALIRLEGALVRAQAYVDDKFGKKTIHSAKLGVGSWEGRKAGRAAADKIQLGQKGVGTSGAKLLR